MHLRSLEVWHWQGLEHVCLDDLSERLNLVYGRNESGKSRLFGALRFALFESHKGQAQHKKALLGWADPEPPRVVVELEAEGTVYRVEKRFLKGPFAHLQGGGETLEDDAAEERLRRLLGVGAGKSSGVPPEEQGLWRLLWLPQGHSRTIPHDDLNEAPRSDLQDLLAREVGEIAAGPLGLRILERAREEAGRFWTPTGKATGELGAATAEHERARERRDGARARRDEAHREAEELIALEQRLRGLEPRLEVQRRRRAEAAAKLEAAEKARRQLETEDARLEGLRLRVERAEGRLLERERAEERRKEIAQRLRGLAGELEAGARQVERLEAEHAASAKAVEAAEEALQEAREAVREARRESHRRQLLERLEERSQILERARAHRLRARELEEGTAKVGLGEEEVARLAELERRKEQAEAKLAGAAARLRITALRSLEIDDEEVAAGQERSWEVAQTQTIEIAGVARLEVAPGGGDLARLRDRARDAEAELGAALREAGVEDRSEAEVKLAERRRLEGELEVERRLLASLAPGGVDLLESEIAGLEAKVEALGEEEATTTTLEQAEAQVEKAEVSLGEARERRDAHKERLDEARRRQADQARERQGLEAEDARLAEQLAQLEERASLEKALVGARAELAEAKRRRQALTAAFEEAGGGAAPAEHERAAKSLEALERQRETLEGERRRLQARLEVRGAEGLHEAWQEAEQACEEAAVRLERVAARAAAARKLLDTLEAERRASQQRLTAPVRRRIEPYLAELFPGSALDIDERWQVGGLATADLKEPFDALSAGAQEQLGILVRVGLAEILAGDGRLPLILDDALVHTDEGRREAMLRILYRASRRLQVIVFTCHEGAFDGLGTERLITLPGGRGGGRGQNPSPEPAGARP